MKRIIISLLSLAVCATAFAKVELPSILGNGMVLQRNAEVTLWGKAQPGARLTVTPSWDGHTYTTSVGSDGRWSIKVSTSDAGGPYTLTFSDSRKSSTVVEDILLGEVWICSGQSNMEMPVKGYVAQPVAGSAQAIRDCYAHQGVRIFNVGRNDADTPQEDCSGEWQHSTPESVANCSAVAYFFGREVSDLLGVPVGLVTSYWGGTMIETWMTRESVLALDVDKSVFDEVPEGPAPGHLYNGMINPIVNYTAKGFIWYQGESNRYHPFDYATLMSRMINLWREAWGDGDMPFIAAQLAQYRYDGAEYLTLPVLVEQQYKAADSTPNTYIASTTDMDSPSIIHPSRKILVGERMAAIALTHTYGMKGLSGESPRYTGMDIDGSKVTLHFSGMADTDAYDFKGEFFSWLDKDLKVIRIKGFEVAGEDRVFHPATAHPGWPIASYIEVQCDEVPHPVAVRYAFRNVLENNVITGAGVPLAPFRTDNWEITPEMLHKVE